MIELRWKEGFVHVDADTAKLVKVLQYRQKPPPVMEIIPQPWSDWTDVPTVGSAEE